MQIAQWLFRYHTDTEFRLHEECNAARATDNELTALEVQMNRLEQIIGESDEL